MNSKEDSLLMIYVIIDLVLLSLSIWCAWYMNIRYIVTDFEDIKFHILQACFAWIVAYIFFGKQNLYLRDSFRHCVFIICRRTIWFVLILIALTFISKLRDMYRIYMLSYILLFVVAEVVTYKIIYLYIEYRRNHGWHTKRILLIGYSHTTNLFRKMLENTPMLGYEFIGYLKYDTQDINDIPTVDHGCIIGNISDMEEIIRKCKIEVVFSEFSFFKNRIDISEPLSVCNFSGIRMYLISENRHWFIERNRLEELGNFHILNPQHIPLDLFINRFGKRLFDILFSSIVLIVGGLTILPFIAILIKLTSRGPVFFIQCRTGLNNRPFSCYKFRSMVVNMDSDRLQATLNDSRITRFGRFLRKSNFDELPQFFNVFCGHMSVIGPRPHMLKHTEQYSTLIRHYGIRHYVKPGISGWAQVNGWRGETKELHDMEERIKYDMEYIENWSFLWDLKIIWLTVFGRDVKKNRG